MDKRDLIRKKSKYKRKWRLKDELKFRWILYKLRKKPHFSCEEVSPQVRDMLEKYGKRVDKAVIGSKYVIW